MHARILSATENSRTVWHDHGDGSVTIQKVADVTNAVERAKELHKFTAAQAAQKHQRGIVQRLCAFTAAQAAQKKTPT